LVAEEEPVLTDQIHFLEYHLVESFLLVVAVAVQNQVVLVAHLQV
jgi:hypothetical protein